MAKRDWQQQSTGGEATLMAGYNMLAVAEKTSTWGSGENQKRLKLTDAAEKDTESGGQISNRGVTIMDTHMEDLEQKREDEQVNCSSPKPEELFFYKFF
ncbi:hypothetical protein CDL15_Pgr007342 [Punica granatum]|uniref:Uncharacterized protein n=1 Tax=Punica granatum TaxID=22663 RepID=A0A218X8Q9_PUNGR|nr:hypothetical protein CDL15_Pgr007342 [Punica granatum]PKI67745.1 hypothetical protein CRG98_011958 [Punica granatum]